jgi:hypothetical protein
VTQTEQEIETGIVTATETERTRNVEDQQGRFARCACGCFEGVGGGMDAGDDRGLGLGWRRGYGGISRCHMDVT